VAAGFAVDIADDIAEIPQVLDAVTAFAATLRLPGPEVQHVCLALDELLTNIIFYAFQTQGGHRINARVSFESDRLAAEITDSGIPFDPFSYVSGNDFNAPLQTRSIGGLGFHPVRALTDETAQRRDGSTNHVLITKAIKPTVP
jgi:serine/threonine-protein kinase RsbW